MERMWRKVNHSFTGRTSKSTATIQSTDTTSSAGFGEGQIVVAVANNCSSSAGTGNLPSSTATGRRLAASGVQSQTVITPNQQKSLSQHVLLNSTASSERRRRRRRKSRPRRSGDTTSSGFGHHQIMESTNQQHHHHHQQLYQSHDQEPLPPPPPPQPPQQQQQQQQSTSSSALMMGVSSSGTACYPPIVAPNNQQQDVSLRQRAVAKLRMFNFHLNWDLHMTQCKPCGPRSGGGNIITRRLCRNRRRDDNELYRSNSFKFERFERKECNEEFADTLQKKISICDDYSLPIDFVKKRPSSFDPCLAEAIPNPETWVAPSPLSDLVNFIEPPSATLGGGGATVVATAAATSSTAPPPPPPPTSSSAGNVNTSTSNHLQSHQPSQHRSHHHPPLPNTIKQASVKLIEGYSDPKDTKRPKKVYHKKSKPRKEHKRSNYSSDSSAPKSSADEDDTNSVKAPELNSPDSISEDLVRPLPPLHRSPRKLTTLSSDATANSKRNPSPYYYSDLLKTKDTDKETKQKSRQSTASEPPQLTQQPVIAGAYRKSTSLDVPEVEREQPEGASDIAQQLTPKRYSFTEEGVRIIRCTTPSTSTSDDSDCSECQKRREWHARALALVRQTCNIQGVVSGDKVELQLQPNQFIPLESELQSMPPHRLLGPAVCACAAPTIGDDLDEYFRPRSIFYVHPQGVHECADCSASTNSVNNLTEEQQITAEQLEDEGEMSGGRTRQFYETAFDCKITKSDDDLDEVDRITNHSVLLQIENGNNVPKAKPSSDRKTRLEGKRLKNSKNQAIQEKTNASATAAASGTTNSSSTVGSGGAIAGSVTALSNDLENVHIDHNTSVDQMNNTTSNSQLPMRGYTPSPPSTAPLPMKFPSKHDRFFMNSIKSAPNLPSSNPAAHPRLKDLRLPIQSHHRAMHAAASIDSQNSSFAEKSRTRPERPRSFVLESGRVLELRKSGGGGGSSGHHHHVGHAQASSNNSSPANGRRHQHNYSSTESIATSSSGGSMESLRSSTSEGNRSTSSSGSRHSTSLSSHSSESGSSLAFPLRAPIVIHSKLHILSPISDKSSQEPASDASELQKNASPEEQKAATADNNQQAVPEVLLKKQRRPPPNKTLLHLADEILGSDSGISLHSRGEDGKKSGLHKFTLPKLNFPSSEKTDSGIGPISGIGLPQDLRDLPFDMPKLRRRKTLQQDTCTSGSATSVDLGDLPFDMPKLRRRLRMNQTDMTSLLVHSTESSGISQASSSHSMRDENKAIKLADTAIFRQNLTLNLNEPARSTTKFGSLDLRGIPSNKELNLNLITGFTSAVDLIDISVPLERQGWYHGAITRIEAETTLRPLSEGSFLVRNCESTKQDYSLSLKGAKGFMHMRIQRNDSGQYILGQFSRPFDSVPEMIRHFCLNRLPVRGAEHMCLIDPVIAQLL